MIKAADYIMDFIAGLGVEHVFCVTGGGAMHMNDALGRSEKLKGVFTLHEQGAAIAAEAYARIREGFGACLVTSGPGATNALTALCGCYMDSIPVLFISGQAKRADLVGDQNIRQFGIQEVNIIRMVKDSCNYAAQIDDPETLRYHLEKAAALMQNGRPGPAWLDVPLDIQASMIDPESQQGFDTENLPQYPADEVLVREAIKHLNQSEKPVMIVGNGVRLAHAVPLLREFLDTYQIPVLTSWNGTDLVEDDHPMYFGRPGSVGDRSANLIQQSADFVLSVGTRLSILNSGYNYAGFLKNAFHVMVDIDENEMRKKSLSPELPIAADAASFFETALKLSDLCEKKDRSAWFTRCLKIREAFPPVIPEQAPREGFVSIYNVVDKLSDLMTADDIYQFTSSGTSVDIGKKVLRLKKGQRAFLNKSMAAMGYDVPAAIGSCIGSGGKRTVLVTGDGSIAMNMQELEVIRRLNLPVKIFVADNDGYSMIYSSQTGNFKGRLTGCTEESGLSLPNMNRVALAFGIPGFRIENEENLEEKLREAMDSDGPVLVTFHADITQKILPKQSNYMNAQGQMESRPIEDMTPLLSREELQKWTS